MSIETGAVAMLLVTARGIENYEWRGRSGAVPQGGGAAKEERELCFP